MNNVIPSLCGIERSLMLMIETFLFVANVDPLILLRLIPFDISISHPRPLSQPSQHFMNTSTINSPLTMWVMDDE